MTLSSADQQARSRFQSGLLAWLRTAGDPSGLREMIAVVRGQVVDDAPNALLWRSAEAFLNAMLDGATLADEEARQLCRRLERQLAPPRAGDQPDDLADALFAWVSNRAPRSANAPEVERVPAPAALKGMLGAAADVLPLLALDPSPRRFDETQLARWQDAARALDAAWQRRLINQEDDCRAAATRLAAAALELGDAAALQLAEALADAVGLAEDSALRDSAPFRAAMAAALEIAAAPGGPEDKGFDARAGAVARRLADNRTLPARPVLPGGPRLWFAEDAREWLQELAAAIDAVPPKRLALLAGLEWLAQQEACNMMAIRGLATLAHKVVRQVRTDDLDEPAAHALVVETIRALDAAVAELASGLPPRPDEGVFARLRRLDADLNVRRKLLSSEIPSQ